MPPPLQLIGESFGKLTVEGLRPERDRHGRRVYRCRCECGKTKDVSTMLLRNGHITSCGRPPCCGRRGRPFTSKAARAEHKAALVRRDEEGEWWAPRRSAAYVGETQGTLVEWHEKGCPWLPEEGQCLRMKPFPSAYNREIAYYFKPDLDAVRTAKAARGKAPRLAGHQYIGNVCKALGVSVRTLNREMEAAGEKAVKVRGKRLVCRRGKKEWWPCVRSYVPDGFVERFMEARASGPQGKESVASAAGRLGVKRADVNNLIAAGLLAGEPGEAVTEAEAREGGRPLRYPRRCTLVSTKAVDRLLAAMEILRGQPPGAGAAARPGRRPGLLRRAAEALGDGTVVVPEPNGHAPPPVEAPPAGLKPRWDGGARTLFLGDDPVKVYGNNPAERQIDLLEAFERESWPPSVLNPFRSLPHGRDLLKQTCKDLNSAIRGRMIRFGGDGTGEGVRWSAG